FYAADFSFSRSRRSELHTLRELMLREQHTFLRKELAYLRQAAYAAALVEQTTETETPLPGIYELMRGFLDYLPQHEPQPRSVMSFELKLLNELGLTPEAERTQLSAGTRELLKAM